MSRSGHGEALDAPGTGGVCAERIPPKSVVSTLRLRPARSNDQRRSRQRLPVDDAQTGDVLGHPARPKPATDGRHSYGEDQSG